MSLHLPPSMGDALDLWLNDAPALVRNAAGETARAALLAWWLGRTGPVVWRARVVAGDLDGTITLSSIHAPPYRDDPYLRSAYLVPIPCPWNQPEKGV